MNKRYQDLQLTPGTYVPPVRTDYPEDDPYVGLYKPVYDRDFPAVDADYPYFDLSLPNRLRVWYGYHVVRPILGLVLRLRYGLRWRTEDETRWHRCAWPVRRWLRQFDLSRGRSRWPTTVIATTAPLSSLPSARRPIPAYRCLLLISERATSATCASSAVYLSLMLRRD